MIPITRTVVRVSCKIPAIFILKYGCQLLGLIFLLILRSYDYNMQVEYLVPANLCLVTLVNLDQCSQFERFHLQHVEMVNKTSSFKTKFIGKNAKASRVICNTL